MNGTHYADRGGAYQKFSQLIKQHDLQIIVSQFQHMRIVLPIKLKLNGGDIKKAVQGRF